MGPSLRLCLWQIFNKLYWLSDSRGWFLIGATKGKGSSRNLLVVVVVVDQAEKTKQCTTPADFPVTSPTFITKNVTIYGTTHCPLQCAPWQGTCPGICVLQGAQASYGLLYSTWNGALGSWVSSWFPCFFSRKTLLNVVLLKLASLHSGTHERYSQPCLSCVSI